MTERPPQAMRRQLPKRLALLKPEWIAALLVRPIGWLQWLVAPVVDLLTLPINDLADRWRVG